MGLLMLLATGCGSTVEVGGGERVGRIEQPIWRLGEQTDEGRRALVCIPRDDGCLRLSVIINEPERIDTQVTGALVEHGCAPMAEPLATVESFHGTAFTGHGVLALEGDTILGDGTDIDLDVEADLGDCY